MTPTSKDLRKVDRHWAVQTIPRNVRAKAFKAADVRLARGAFGQNPPNTKSALAVSDEVIGNVATAYELAAIEGLSEVLHSSQSEESEGLRSQARAGAHKAFGLYRVLPIATKIDHRIFHVLHLAGLACCGERWTDLRHWLRDSPQATEIPSVVDAQWDEKLLYRLFDCWIRLLRKNSRDDIDQIPEIVHGLRNDQSKFEPLFIEKHSGMDKKAMALKLMALYHLAKATEMLAVFMLQGEPVDIDSELDHHFEAAIKASRSCRDIQLEMVLNWLHLASRKMTEGSLLPFLQR